EPNDERGGFHRGPQLRRQARRGDARSGQREPGGDQRVFGRRCVIEVETLDAGYGSLRVLKQVSLRVGEGELVTVVGANGAGTSTLLRSIQGLLSASAGSVRFMGRDITRLRTEQIVRLGLTLVPETRELFPELTVTDNLVLGAYVHRREAAAMARRERDLTQMVHLFPVLPGRRATAAAPLRGGRPRMRSVGPPLL